jgi:3-hydroxyisobutyrate dehydrogenase-like beta-hydroxyacid dehydrogenase
MQKVKVGFIGLGVMGKPMAMNLLKAGFDTVVYDVAKGPLAELLKIGAKVCSSPKELAAECDVVISMVRDDKQTEDVINGKEGVLAGLSKGAIIITSTISPGCVQRLAQNVKIGIEVLDAPVSGSVMGAEDGTLTFMLGGEKEALEHYRPIFEAMGNRMIYCGGVGAGLVAKLTNSMIVAVTIAGVINGLALGKSAGLDENFLLNIYRTTTAGSWITNHWDWATSMMSDLRPNGGFEIARKDVRLALEFARERGVSIPITNFSNIFDYFLQK